MKNRNNLFVSAFLCLFFLTASAFGFAHFFGMTYCRAIEIFVSIISSYLGILFGIYSWCLYKNGTNDIESKIEEIKRLLKNKETEDENCNCKS